MISSYQAVPQEQHRPLANGNGSFENGSRDDKGRRLSASTIGSSTRYDNQQRRHSDHGRISSAQQPQQSQQHERRNSDQERQQQRRTIGQQRRPSQQQKSEPDPSNTSSNSGSTSGMGDPGCPMKKKVWRFRDPLADDPVEIALQYKSMALSNISNTQQTFTMTVMEDVAVWITKEDFEDFCKCSNKRHWRPTHFIQTYVYNSSETEWYDQHRTLEGCPFHIRDVYGDGKCWAFRQRQGKIVFHSPFELHNFPFDVQELTCKFALYTYSNCNHARRVLVRPMEGGTTFSKLFVDPNSEYRIYRNHRSFMEHKGYVCCTYVISREWQYYFWKVMVVLSIVTLTSLASFVSFDSYLEQITHLSTVLLTDMAYLYTIQSHMPTLRYLTLLDWWVFGNVFFVFAMFVEITCFEKFNVDMDRRPQGPDGMNLMSLVLLVNLTCWGILVLIFVMIAMNARQKEMRKLDNPTSEEEIMKEEHEPFECNLFCGGAEQTLMLTDT